MHRSRAPATFSFPRNGSAQRVIDFENSGSVSKAFQLFAIRTRQSISCYGQELPGSHVKQDRSRQWKFSQIGDPAVKKDLPAQRTQMRRKRSEERRVGKECRSR